MRKPSDSAIPAANAPGAARTDGRPIEARLLDSFAGASFAEWQRVLGHEALGADYYLACERAPLDAFRLSAIGAFRNAELIAGMPLFSVTFRLDLPLSGLARSAVRGIGRVWPRLVSIPIVGAGSPTVEQLAIGRRTDLGAVERQACFAALLDGLDMKGRSDRADLLVLKDVTESDADWAHDELARRGFARSAGLPVAMVDLPFATEDEYLASLSPKMRSDVRRKLRQGRAIRIEIRDNIRGLEPEIAALYAETRANAAATYDVFDRLPANYFAAVLDGLGGKGQVLLGWLDEKLVSFALVVVDPRVLVTLYMGMRQPFGRQHNVYFLNWMAAVRLCLERRIPRLHAGQSAYQVKVRLGARLERRWIYYRHRSAFWNLLFRTLGPRVAFDRLDPDLVALAAAAPYG